MEAHYHDGDSMEARGHQCWEGKATKEVAGFPKFTPPQHIEPALVAYGCGGHHWDFTIWSPIAHCIPLRGILLGPGRMDHTGDAHLPREHNHFPPACRDLKSWRSAREPKNKQINKQKPCDSTPPQHFSGMSIEAG